MIFFKQEFLKTDIKLPEIGNYGVGMIFLPPEKNRASSAIKSIEEAIKKRRSISNWMERCSS
jgi:glutamate synthase domain-containing protein 1